MITATITKACGACGKALRGRSDKKFCDDYCRNQFNNLQKSEDHSLVRTINKKLLKNRRILQSLLCAEQQELQIGKEALYEMGFQFRHFTHIVKDSSEGLYFFCYEYGYRQLQGDEYMLVMKKNMESGSGSIAGTISA